MISNSTPIICLSKINQLSLFKLIFKTIIIPPSVKKEVIIENKPGSVNIINAIKENWIKIIEPKSKNDYGLGAGESSAINLAKERGDTIIIDDAFAIKVANTFDIPTIRTTTIIFIALQKNIITKNQAINLLNELIENGYYISPKEYSILLTRLKE